MHLIIVSIDSITYSVSFTEEKKEQYCLYVFVSQKSLCILWAPTARSASEMAHGSRLRLKTRLLFSQSNADKIAEILCTQINQSEPVTVTRNGNFWRVYCDSCSTLPLPRRNIFPDFSAQIFGIKI